MLSKFLCGFMLLISLSVAQAHNVRYGVVTQLGIDSKSGVIADAPSRISKTLLANNLATEAELEGNTYAVVVALYMPSILGKRPQNWNWYVLPELRSQIQVGSFVRLEESEWQGLGTARWRIVKEVYSKEQYPEIYAQCSDVFQVHVCVEKVLKEKASLATEKKDEPQSEN